MDNPIKHIWDSDNRLLSADELDDDCPRAGEGRPSIEPGQYIAHCFKTDIKPFKNERKLLIWLRLNGGKYDGVELFLPCPYPRGTRSCRTKYYNQWTIANGAPPRKGERMARSVFTDKKFRILVGDSKRRFENGELMPESLQYSIVKSILGIIEDENSN